MRRLGFTVAFLIGVGATGAAAMALLAPPRDGLFNNIANLDDAMRSHLGAWAASESGTTMSRARLRALVTRFGQECITERADWTSVDLSHSLNQLAASRQPFACQFRVRGRWPAHFPETYTWTLVLTPLSGDWVRLMETRRQTFAD